MVEAYSLAQALYILTPLCVCVCLCTANLAPTLTPPHHDPVSALLRRCVVVVIFVLIVSTFIRLDPAAAADYSRISFVSHGLMSPQV